MFPMNSARLHYILSTRRNTYALPSFPLVALYTVDATFPNRLFSPLGPDAVPKFIPMFMFIPRPGLASPMPKFCIFMLTPVGDANALALKFAALIDELELLLDVASKGTKL